MRNQISLLSKKQARILSSVMTVVILASAVLACNVPVQSLVATDPDQSQGSPLLVTPAIVKTLTARALEENEGNGSENMESGQGVADDFKATKTPSSTPSPTFTQTSTPLPQVHISENTNCRYGPAEVFDLISTFLAGDIADLVGKDQEELYWYVQHQEQEDINCWLWGKYATPEGKTTGLPVFTPPPTPTPVVDFAIAYKETGSGSVVVNIKNTGDLTLESWVATFKDKVTAESVTNSSSQFGSSAKIPVGKANIITSAAFSASPVGHKIKATIKICTDDSQQGICVTKSAEFKAQ